ncbi:hypothetical protein CY0110_18912 [Crocosphaera chwakensis CCY0110]|uniref:Uncharacterized protein n=1 Tax=Crocosphaera chwakensis CCY0110 TaxID=391612 RepID=A3IJB4_9CHRO|nr:hypothetical protein CY0110_18912 [Crocosphaera chwakensis CCY0110]
MGKTPSWDHGGISVKNLTNTAHTTIIEMISHRFKKTIG